MTCARSCARQVSVRDASLRPTSLFYLQQLVDSPIWPNFASRDPSIENPREHLSGRSNSVKSREIVDNSRQSLCGTFCSRISPRLERSLRLAEVSRGCTSDEEPQDLCALVLQNDLALRSLKQYPINLEYVTPSSRSCVSHISLCYILIVSIVQPPPLPRACVEM